MRLVSSVDAPAKKTKGLRSPCVICKRTPGRLAGCTGWTFVFPREGELDLSQSSAWCPSCYDVGVKRGILERLSPEQKAERAENLREAMLGPAHQEMKRVTWLFAAYWGDWCKAVAKSDRRRKRRKRARV